jgi:hypothetical protein
VKVEPDVGAKGKGVLGRLVKDEESLEVEMSDVPMQLRKWARTSKNTEQVIKEENPVKRPRWRLRKLKPKPETRW